MCVVCLEWQKGKMTSREALGTLGEMIVSATEEENKHYWEVSEKIMDSEVPMKENDKELDTIWQNNDLTSPYED